MPVVAVKRPAYPYRRQRATPALPHEPVVHVRAVSGECRVEQCDQGLRCGRSLTAVRVNLDDRIRSRRPADTCVCIYNEIPLSYQDLERFIEIQVHPR